MRRGQKKHAHPTNNVALTLIITTLGVLIGLSILTIGRSGYPSGDILSFTVFSGFLNNKELSNSTYSRFEKGLVEIDAYTKTKEGLFSIQIIDLIGKRSYSLNSNAEIYGASLYKLPVGVGLAKYIEEGNATWGTEVSYLPQDFSDGTGKITLMPFRTRLSYSELLFYLFHDSDNVAQNIIIRSIPKEYIERAFTEVVRDESMRTSYQNFYVNNILTTTMYSKYTLELLKGDYISRENKQTLLQYLTNTAFEDRISPAILSSGYSFSHKIGSWPGSWHDCGLIYGDRPIIVCLMTEGVSYNDMKDVANKLGETLVLIAGSE